MFTRLTADIKKRKDNDEDEQRLPVEPKLLRIHETTADLQTQYNQPLMASPVESPFRAFGDRHVPPVESKKEATKTVKWNEQIQTFQKVNLLL